MGSNIPDSSTAATIEVVVVFPCVPAIAIFDFKRINSANISDLRITGIFFLLASFNSKFSELIAEEITIISAASIFLES